LERVTGLDFNAWIEQESETFAAVLDNGQLDRRVPGCPDWALRDLGFHLGGVQRFWARAVRAGTDVDPTRPEMSRPNDAELAAWMRASTRDLLEALRGTPADTPAWTWWRDLRTAGAIARHQVQEAAVHRWDAQSAVGDPDPVKPPIADDGVDEFVWIARQLREPAAITLVATDSGRSFPVFDGPSAVTVSATASDLVLVLYTRITTDRVQVDGDRSVLDAFLQPIG
jgi:uncharacterized protein (TIGR03083 family)